MCRRCNGTGRHFYNKNAYNLSYQHIARCSCAIGEREYPFLPTIDSVMKLHTIAPPIAPSEALEDDSVKEELTEEMVKDLICDEDTKESA